MTSDLDIYRTASVLIREHGEDAALEAAQRHLRLAAPWGTPNGRLCSVASMSALCGYESARAGDRQRAPQKSGKEWGAQIDLMDQ